MRTWRRKYYDRFSRFYDRFVALHSSDRQGNLRAFLARKTGVAPGQTTLDICTGTGALLIELHARMAGRGRVVGLDFSAGMLSVAQRKTVLLPAVALVQAEADRLPFKDGVFDAITCAHAFYELKGQAQDGCLNEVCRTLKPGRPFLMMEHAVPRNRVVRLLFYIRLLSMGARQALQILKYERRFLERYFYAIQKIATPSGKSKIWFCTQTKSLSDRIGGRKKHGNEMRSVQA